jgi:phospholipid-transporting ATPase
VNALEDRETLVELAFEEIEHSMRLLGCTGVEDQLQEYVPESIDFMIKAGLKVVVLTGDKKETAVTISRQCALIQDSFKLLYMQGGTKDEAKQSLDATVEEWRRMEQEETAGKQQPFALAIDGLCMELCLKHYRPEFISLFLACKTIVSYRSTPRQKALCVAMAKKDLNASVLAIGDGANGQSSGCCPVYHCTTAAAAELSELFPLLSLSLSAAVRRVYDPGGACGRGHPGQGGRSRCDV